jgi:hypothetical protein
MYLYVFYRFLLISSFIAFWSDHFQSYFNFLHLLRLAWWLRMWCILKEIPRASGKNVYSANISRYLSICSIVHINSEVSSFFLFKWSICWYWVGYCSNSVLLHWIYLSLYIQLCLFYEIGCTRIWCLYL